MTTRLGSLADELLCALVDLPGIDGARVWEPAPAQVYRWELH